AAAPDAELVVWPSRVNPYVVLVALLDLLVLFVREVTLERPRVIAATGGHLLFLGGAALLGDVVHPLGGAPVSPAWAIRCPAAGFLLLTMTFLWAMSEQVSRFRLAALTDSGTRLWNRQALFEEISARIEQRRRKEGATFGLIIVDLDRFKDWNDRMGHLAGDR